ncbi:MAG: DUF2478 domain-containing protein [Rhodobacteraceae bacterium]|nr:DUF2478 domain-containing protein [Paracoccaceae bacterium]
MKIAYTLAQQTGGTNTTLETLATELLAQGLKLCGTVQIDTPKPGSHHCDMDVKVLPDGPILRISQSLGEAATGCRLDPAALEQAVALTLKQIEQGADLLIINKFGKHEADGRGFRAAIAEAAARDIPILVGTNALNEDALRSFCGGEIRKMPADADALLNWVKTVVFSRQAA